MRSFSFNSTGPQYRSPPWSSNSFAVLPCSISSDIGEGKVYEYARLITSGFLGGSLSTVSTPDDSHCRTFYTVELFTAHSHSVEGTLKPKLDHHISYPEGLLTRPLSMERENTCKRKRHVRRHLSYAGQRTEPHDSTYNHALSAKKTVKKPALIPCNFQP
jgi:hypothetical protein